MTHDDLRLLRAVQIAPRAPFAAIASALGLSETTVARRYRKLVATGVCRVVGVRDPGAQGTSEWFVRIRCRPGSGGRIADALARRRDVSWVSHGAAGTEIACVISSPTTAQRDELLGRQLPGTAAVLEMSAAVMLHRFTGGRAHYWAALTGVLTVAEEARLGSDGTRPFTDAPVVPRATVAVSQDDERLLSVLAADGRASHVALGEAAGLTPGQAARRLRGLLDQGAAHLDVEIVPEALGFTARAGLWMRVHPRSVAEVGALLAEQPEIAFAAAVSGQDNVHAVAHCRDLDALYRFTSERLGTLPGLLALEVSPIVRQVKQAGSLLDGDRLVPGRTVS